MRLRLLAAILLLASPGCATTLLTWKVDAAALGRSELVREVAPDLIVEEIGDPPDFYCVDATYPDGVRVRYDVRPDPDGWHVQTPGTTTWVRVHDPDHRRGLRLVPEQDFDFAHGVLDIRGRSGNVTLRLQNYDEYKQYPPTYSQRTWKVVLVLLYPAAIAVDAITWPAQLVFLALLDPTGLP